jgi:E3 ubiquitin-protein ligase RNF115/126
MGGRVRSPPSPDSYGGEPLLRTVGSIFQELAGAYNTQNRNGPPPDREDPWETPGATRGANMHGGLWTRNTDSPEPPTVPLASLNEYVCAYFFCDRYTENHPSVMI